LEGAERGEDPVVIAEYHVLVRQASAQVALNWLVNAHGDTIVAIPGASKAAHAQESAGAMAFALASEEMSRLGDLTSPFR
jgi:diketogulonate reductase-like aldo/keto reductase